MTTILQIQSALHAGTDTAPKLASFSSILFHPFLDISPCQERARGRPGREGLEAQVSLSRLMDQAELQIHLCGAASLSHFVERLETSLMRKGLWRRHCLCQDRLYVRPKVAMQQSHTAADPIAGPLCIEYASCRPRSIILLI